MIKLNAQTVNTFVESSINVFSQFSLDTDQPLSLGNVYMEKLKLSQYEVEIYSLLSGDYEGRVLLGMSVDSAIEIAERMTGAAVDTFDEDAQSALSELMNLILGSALHELEKNKKNVKMSPVKLKYGGSEPIGTLQCPYPVTVPIYTQVGNMELDIAFY
ncbi:MAG: chemotaxis protein CheX [Gammaproteobacteria bacterium]|nr:chemotaxis protein CheX [Gammaproteobacteria bacterium]